MGIIAWIIFGALAGWVASLIMGTSTRQGCLLDIVVGVVGAFIGGALVELTTGSSFSARFNLTSFIVAVLGAVVLLFLLNVLRRGRV